METVGGSARPWPGVAAPLVSQVVPGPHQAWVPQQGTGVVHVGRLQPPSLVQRPSTLWLRSLGVEVEVAAAAVELRLPRGKAVAAPVARLMRGRRRTWVAQGVVLRRLGQTMSQRMWSMEVWVTHPGRVVPDLRQAPFERVLLVVAPCWVVARARLATGRTCYNKC